MVFKTSTKIHFNEADPAGIAFSGGLFTKAHQCFEDFIAEITGEAESFFLGSEQIFPIRHMEADFFAPLLPLKEYAVSIRVLKLSDSNFQLGFYFGDDQKPNCVVRSVHVCCNKSNFKKAELPKPLKDRLENFLTV